MDMPGTALEFSLIDCCAYLNCQNSPPNKGQPPYLHFAAGKQPSLILSSTPTSTTSRPNQALRALSANTMAVWLLAASIPVTQGIPTPASIFVLSSRPSVTTKSSPAKFPKTTSTTSANSSSAASSTTCKLPMPARPKTTGSKSSIPPVSN